MSAEVVYEIARYGVRTENEVLIERAQLLSENGELRCRVDDGPEIVCPNNDVVATISADPALSEIRANQVTRITGEPAALQELPFVLRVPGDRDDLDESLWSESMRDEHTTQDWIQPNRVLYVNGARWSAFSTTDGDRTLPEGGDDFIRLTPRWGRLDFGWNHIGTSGDDQAFIGLVTSTAVACATLMDIDPGEDDVVLWRRGKTAMDDARTFVEWLLDGGLVPHYFPGDPGLEGMLAQLFVEASVHGCNGTVVPGSLLAAGAEAELGWGDLHSSEWTLELDLDPPAVIEAVLDLLAERSPRLCDIVTAARYPESRAGRAREARLQKLYNPDEPETVEEWAERHRAMGHNPQPAPTNENPERWECDCPDTPGVAVWRILTPEQARRKFAAMAGQAKASADQAEKSPTAFGTAPEIEVLLRGINEN